MGPAQAPSGDPSDTEQQQGERWEGQERRRRRRRRVDHLARRDLIAWRRLSVGPAAAERVALVGAGDLNAGEADRRGPRDTDRRRRSTRSIPGPDRPRRRAARRTRTPWRRRRSLQTSASLPPAAATEHRPSTQRIRGRVSRSWTRRQRRACGRRRADRRKRNFTRRHGGTEKSSETPRLRASV